MLDKIQNYYRNNYFPDSDTNLEIKYDRSEVYSGRHRLIQISKGVKNTDKNLIDLYYKQLTNTITRREK